MSELNIRKRRVTYLGGCFLSSCVLTNSTIKSSKISNSFYSWTIDCQTRTNTLTNWQTLCQQRTRVPLMGVFYRKWMKECWLVMSWVFWNRAFDCEVLKWSPRGSYSFLCFGVILGRYFLLFFMTCMISS